MVGQPPFAVTSTALGDRTDSRSASPTRSPPRQPGETTNNYGVERDYALGTVQTWNADLSRDLRQVWNVGGGYTHTRGSSLDILRAPNRGPDGLRIDGVQPFLWQSSEGSSTLHAANVPRCGGGRSKASASAPPTRSPARATTPRRSAAAAPSSPRTIATSTPSGGFRASIGGTS